MEREHWPRTDSDLTFCDAMQRKQQRSNRHDSYGLASNPTQIKHSQLPVPSHFRQLISPRLWQIKPSSRFRFWRLLRLITPRKISRASKNLNIYTYKLWQVALGNSLHGTSLSLESLGDPESRRWHGVLSYAWHPTPDPTCSLWRNSSQ